MTIDEPLEGLEKHDVEYRHAALVEKTLDA